MLRLHDCNSQIHAGLSFVVDSFFVCCARAGVSGAEVDLAILRTFWPLQPLPLTFEYNGSTITFDKDKYGGDVLVLSSEREAIQASSQLPLGLPSVSTTMMLLRQKWFRHKFPVDAPATQESFVDEMKNLKSAAAKWVAQPVCTFAHARARARAHTHTRARTHSGMCTQPLTCTRMQTIPETIQLLFTAHHRAARDQTAAIKLKVRAPACVCMCVPNILQFRECR